MGRLIEECGTKYGRMSAIADKMRDLSPLQIYRNNIVSVAAGCLLPPAAGALLLASLFWAARGFRPKNFGS
jgi:hypothetical protein